MSSELLGAAQNVLKGNLGGAWDINKGYADAYTDLGIARRFGGSVGAYSLRDIGAMNGRVVKVRREQDTTPVDFSAAAVASGSIEQFAIGQSVLDKYNNVAYFSADSAYFSVTETTYSGAFTITFSFILTGDLDDNNETTLVWGQSGKANLSLDGAGELRFRRNVGGTATNTDIALDSNIKKNFLHTLTVTRDSSNVVTVVLDGATQSSTPTISGDWGVARMGFRNRGVLFDVNINSGEHIYAGDGAEASNWLDTGSGTTANATKVGSPVAFTGQGISAFIDTWYDQSGNGKDITQPTTTDQPSIIVNGSLVTSANGLPAISFADDGVTVERQEFLSGQLSAYFLVFDAEGGDSSEAQVTFRQGSNYRLSSAVQTNGKIRGQIRDGGGDALNLDSGGDIATGGTVLQSTFIRARGADGFINYAQGANEVKGDSTDVQNVNFALVDTGDFAIGANPGGAFDFKGKMQEAIFFESDLFTDKSTIETELNNHYNAF